MKWGLVILVTLIGGGAGSIILAAAGFIIGAGVADERAGEAAMLLAGIGAVAGFIAGGLISFIIMVIIKAVSNAG